jgi:hypothetical protein
MEAVLPRKSVKRKGGVAASPSKRVRVGGAFYQDIRRIRAGGFKSVRLADAELRSNLGHVPFHQPPQ